MTGTIRNFFASGNTARGYTSLLSSSLQGIQSLMIVDGSPGSGHSNLIREIGSEVSALGHELWIFHTASDPDDIDGWVAPELSTGMITGDAFRGMSADEIGADIQFINLDDTCIDRERLRPLQSEIDRLTLSIRQSHQKAYAGFAEALRIHDEWEALYNEHMDFQAADELASEYTKLLLGDQSLKKQGRMDHRFLGAATPKGAVDYVPNLTEGLKRYLVKGRAGSGKSTMLKKIVASAEERGFDVEVYHCGFDPNSLDMVIVREPGFAIFDSTAPHEYFPDRPDDEIVDTYARCVQPGTDEQHAEALSGFKQRYAAQMKASTQHLTDAKLQLDQLKQLIAPLVDAVKVNEIKDALQREVIGITQKS
ncbi:PRK06851 family protein [Paenibacillus dakarensis]|uniref:PRK06851 family protein n=1 Tax=Paenibacillus dakarensis TaxID=1527293 RepID=UPI0006D5B376|nr:PRK06851 family protein [Paenibacillus dakarensis]